MKNFTIASFVAAVAVAFCFSPVSAQDTLTSIIRPIKVDAKVSGAQIAKPGSYELTVGDLLELEYSYPVVPAAMPKKLTFKTSDRNVLDSTKAVVKSVVLPGLMGSGTKAFCFRAVNPGTESVTLNIDGNEYQYSISVKRAEGDTAEPELCKGVYTVIQHQGKVFIIGNGVHPAAEYRTHFQKAKIAIWPPQHRLMCEKPPGVSAQVLTPFSVQTSFNSNEPVELVVVTDSSGQQTIKVIQLK